MMTVSVFPKSLAVYYGDLRADVPVSSEDVLEAWREAYARLALDPSTWVFDCDVLEGGFRVEVVYDPRDGVGRVYVKTCSATSEQVIEGSLTSVLSRAQQEIARRADLIWR